MTPFNWPRPAKTLASADGAIAVLPYRPVRDNLCSRQESCRPCHLSLPVAATNAAASSFGRGTNSRELLDYAPGTRASLCRASGLEEFPCIKPALSEGFFPPHSSKTLPAILASICWAGIAIDLAYAARPCDVSGDSHAREREAKATPPATDIWLAETLGEARTCWH